MSIATVKIYVGANRYIITSLRYYLNIAMRIGTTSLGIRRSKRHPKALIDPLQTISPGVLLAEKTVCASKNLSACYINGMNSILRDRIGIPFRFPYWHNPGEIAYHEHERENACQGFGDYAA